MKGHTSKSAADLSLRKSLQHVKVEKRDERGVVSPKTVLEVAMVDTDFARGLAVRFAQYADETYL